jgi:hypothetical protein
MSDRVGYSPCILHHLTANESRRRPLDRKLVLEVLEIRACPAATVSLTIGSLSITEGGSQMVMVQAMGTFTGEIVVG